jgi:Holliday junction resolvase RusA-like endonuclease
MQIITFTIPGNPVPKARARTFTNKNKITRTFTPSKTREWETYVSAIARQVAVKNKLVKPHEGPIILGCIFHRSIPKSLIKTKKQRKALEEKQVFPTTKPDLSNYFKSIEDACEGILWKNDSQIIGYGFIDAKYCCKTYSNNPRVEVEVQFLP